MPQDAFTLNYLAKELNALLAGGKVNKITQPNENEFYMNIYAARKNYRVVVSASVASARVCTSSEEKENPANAYNFCMLLRKHLLGATLTSVALAGFDRVIKLTFAGSDEFYEPEEKVLYAEIMGKYSNAVLTLGGKILGALKTAGLEEASKRPLMAGLTYSPPPEQDKLLPYDPELKAALGVTNVGETLFNRVKGISARTADEIAHCTVGDPFEYLNDFIFNSKTDPCVGFDGGRIVDFFVKPYKSLELEYKKFPSLIAAEEYFYGEKERAKKFSDTVRRLTECVKKEEKKFEKRLKIILDKQLDCKDYETDRIKGEIILSNIYRVKKGDKALSADNYYTGGEITVRLDENLTPQENAQKYFKKYNKQKRTLAAVAPQKEEVDAELDYVKALYGEIARAETVAELTDVEEELYAAGYLKKNEKKKKKPAPPKFINYFIDGFTVKVGRNNVENDLLTGSARPKDVWLHTKAYHSAHVIIEAAGRAPSEKAKLIAAEICAYFSDGRDGAKIDVDYTEKRFVKKPKGAKPGFVVYTDFATLTVNPSKHEEFLKQV